MSALITSTYNTGWMNGAIKGAFLSDTSTASLVEPASPLVTNGDFATSSDWTLGSGWSISGGSLNLDTSISGAGVVTAAQQTISTVAGKTYIVSYEVTGATNWDSNEWFIFLGSVNISLGVPPSIGSFTKTVVAQETNAAILTRTSGSVDGNETLSIDNISVKLADADRSVNNKGLIVNGTITRTAVASGANLVAYSGFSAANYLEQPYNSALDFGTGDFCVMGWVNVPDTTNSFRSFERNDLASPNSSKRIVLNVTAGLIGAFAGSSALTSSISANSWTYVAAVRSGGTFYLYKNGVSVASQSNALNLDLATAIVRLGSGVQFSGLNHSLALWRISATAPTATQIAKIYADELPLFQANARATLYGASDAVQALAHDPDTGLLHVGTSAGRSVFRGLERLSNTTTSVAATISASGGLVVSK
jgi:hypothetical protein